MSRPVMEVSFRVSGADIELYQYKESARIL